MTDIGFTGGGNGAAHGLRRRQDRPHDRRGDMVDHIVELVEAKAAELEAEKDARSWRRSNDWLDRHPPRSEGTARLPRATEVVRRIEAYAADPGSRAHDIAMMRRLLNMSSDSHAGRRLARTCSTSRKTTMQMLRVRASPGGIPMRCQSDRLARDYDELEDQHDALAVQLARVESANEELIPDEIIHRLSAGEAPVAVWRSIADCPRGAAERRASAWPKVRAIEAGTEPRLRAMAADRSREALGYRRPAIDLSHMAAGLTHT